MEMRFLTAVLSAFVASVALAHDDGHGPALSDAGKFGGIVSGVVLKSEASKGAHAGLVYKAELARAQDGTVRVYLYNDKMQPLDLKTVDAKATATLSAKVKGKYKNTAFNLEKKDGSFIGKMPKPDAKPYNIDVVFKEPNRELLSAFDNLD
jgi:hypothetical protein